MNLSMNLTFPNYTPPIYPNYTAPNYSAITYGCNFTNTTNGLESWIGCNAVQTMGNIQLVGVLFVGFFLGFVLMQNVRLEVKILILFPAAILSMLFFGYTVVWLLAGIPFGMIVWIALQKLFNRG